MNAIRKQKANSRSDAAGRQAITQQINDFRSYLASAKFQGPCNDYISTHEVLARLAAIEATITTVEDHHRRREASADQIAWATYRRQVATSERERNQRRAAARAEIRAEYEARS